MNADTTPWGIQRELIMREPAGTGELAIHEFPAAWEVRAIEGTLDVKVLHEETERTLALLNVLQGDLVRTSDGATVNWPEAPRNLYTVTVVEGCDVDAMADAVHRPFRLRQSDRARAVIATPQDGVGYLLVAIDHVYADGQTIALVYEEIFRRYSARVTASVATRFDAHWGSFAEVVRSDYRAPVRDDERTRYFERMRAVAFRVKSTRADFPVEELRATQHHRVLLPRQTSDTFTQASRRMRLPLGEVVAAGMLAIHPPEMEFPVAFARHGRTSSRWFRTPGTAYENVFAAPIRAGYTSEQIRSELASVPSLGGAWPTDYLTAHETYELRRRASSTFPKTRPIAIPGGVVTAADALYLQIFGYTDDQVDQERCYELFIMAWPCDDGRLFLNAHVDPRCVPDPEEYLDQLITSVAAL